MPQQTCTKPEGSLQVSEASPASSQVGWALCGCQGLCAGCLQQPSSGTNPWPLKRGCPACCSWWGSLQQVPERAALAHMLRLDPEGSVQVSDLHRGLAGYSQEHGTLGALRPHPGLRRGCLLEPLAP